MVAEKVRNVKYLEASEDVQKSVDNILSTLNGLPLLKVKEILRIAQSEVYLVEQKVLEGVTIDL